ncbi:MAG: sugar phosphate isomerase/epimerase [Phycisphaerales bacterium]|nr:sugar phosphate isomerase/epimerase [Phycisphaerales bacterium]
MPGTPESSTANSEGHLSRRNLLSGGVAAVAAATVPAMAQEGKPAPRPRRWQKGRSPWPLCMDTATIRPTSLEDKVRIAAEAGFDAIEPWEGELRDYEAGGGDLKDLGRKIKDAGLFVPSVIGLWNAIPPTEEEWKKQLPESRDRMRMVSAIGSEFVQVIPQPRRPWQEFDLAWASAKYRELLEIGLEEYNLNPAMVFVEFLPGAARMGQAAAIALDADHPKAKIIPDAFHMYIGDSGFSGLRLIQGEFIAIFQFNDAPAQPAKPDLEDKHRVFPGDGILPLVQCLKDLEAIDYRRCISLELYNPEYWTRDPLDVAKEGRDKTLKVIQQATE